MVTEGDVLLYTTKKKQILILLSDVVLAAVQVTLQGLYLVTMEEYIATVIH